MKQTDATLTAQETQMKQQLDAAEAQAKTRLDAAQAQIGTLQATVGQQQQQIARQTGEQQVLQQKFNQAHSELAAANAKIVGLDQHGRLRSTPPRPR